MANSTRGLIIAKSKANVLLFLIDRLYDEHANNSPSPFFLLHFPIFLHQMYNNLSVSMGESKDVCLSRGIFM